MFWMNAQPPSSTLTTEAAGASETVLFCHTPAESNLQHYLKPITGIKPDILLLTRRNCGSVYLLKAAKIIQQYGH
jgi:hypothetical protein